MRSKFYILIAFITFSVSFSQIKDTLDDCNGRLKDIIISNLESAYQDRDMSLYKKKFIKTGRVLSCVNDELREIREMSCQNAKLI
jgi:hypothetical protein